MMLRTFISKNVTWVVAALISLYFLTLIFSMGYFKNNYDIHFLYQSFPNKAWTFYKIISTICLVYFTTLCLFVLPVKIIFFIAKGKPFDRNNVKNIHAVAYFLLLLVVFCSVEQFIVRVITLISFHRDPLIEKFPLDTLIPHQCYWYLLAGVIVFIIARAFKRGYDLQKEQELTI